jgi:hypothetical protein
MTTTTSRIQTPTEPHYSYYIYRNLHDDKFVYQEAKQNCQNICVLLARYPTSEGTSKYHTTVKQSTKQGMSQHIHVWVLIYESMANTKINQQKACLFILIYFISKYFSITSVFQSGRGVLISLCNLIMTMLLILLMTKYII